METSKASRRDIRMEKQRFWKLSGVCLTVSICFLSMMFLLLTYTSNLLAGQIVEGERKVLEKILANAGLAMDQVRILYEKEDWEFVEPTEEDLNKGFVDEGYLAIKEIRRSKPRNLISCRNTVHIDHNGRIVAIAFYNTRLVDLSLFKPLERLTSLYLNKNPLDSLKSMPNLLSLRELKVYYCQLIEMKGLPNTPNLEVLDLTDNSIARITDLAKLSRLKYLILNRNAISKIEGLENLKQLELLQLNAGKHLITKLENLDNLLKLKKLEVIGQPISEIEGLDKLTHLKTLVLTGTNIDRLCNMKSLVNLEWIGVSGTNISNLKGVDQLANLKHLGVGELPIKSLSTGLESLNLLEEIYAVDSKLETLKDIPSLPKLKELNLGRTKITSLEGLDRLPNLEFVDLIGAPVYDLTHYEKLHDMTLWLSGIKDTEENRKAVKVMLKNKVELKFHYLKK